MFRFLRNSFALSVLVFSSYSVPPKSSYPTSYLRTIILLGPDYQLPSIYFITACLTILYTHSPTVKDPSTEFVSYILSLKPLRKPD